MKKKPYIIAEIGCNHKGDMSIAKELIRVAAIECKADAIKLQKRTPKELLSKEEYNAPHPNPMHAYGETYGAHREFLELSIEQHRELKEYCDKLQIEYSTSVWDMTSAREITSLKPKFIKIPSAMNTNYPMLAWLCENYPGEIHVSVGMTSHEETQRLIDFFVGQNRNQDLVIYSCTSGYPVPFEDVCLLEISKLTEQFGSQVKEIGFSGHHLGTAIDIAAYTLGAATIERHFTLNRTWKGTDHSASLEPDELKRLVQDLKNTHLALTYKREEILDIEKVQRAKLKYKGNEGQ